jgi:alkylhydroperoxidase family enzyme
MTTTTATVAVPVRLDVDPHAAAFGKAMTHLDNAATRQLDDVGFDPGLRDLLRLRASQINGCAY